VAHVDRLRRIAAVFALVLAPLAGASTGRTETAAAAGSCPSVGAAATAFPAAGYWGVVNQQTFNGSSLPAGWDPFLGYFDGGSGQAHHSYREASMLAFTGAWMRFKNQIFSDNDHSGRTDADGDTDAGTDSAYYTVADAGANEVYAETFDPGTGSYVPGYDVASHEWGFQWCARFNGGPGLDTAFAFVPTDGAWPPEIDFIEHGPRNGNTVTLHIHWRATRYNDGHTCDPNYPRTNSQNCHANFPQIKLIVARWHTYAVTWSQHEIDVWIDGRRINSLTVTPRICTARADQPDGYGDTGIERLCLPNGYLDNVRGDRLEPYVWDMQANSYNGTTTYSTDQTDLAWFKALRPTALVHP
jgi:hypothetical protein